MNLMDQILTSIRSLFMSGTNGCSSVSGNKPHFTFFQLPVLVCGKHFLPAFSHLDLPCFGSSVSKSHCWGPSGQGTGHGFHSKVVLFKEGTLSMEVLSSKLRMGGQRLPLSFKVMFPNVPYSREPSIGVTGSLRRQIKLVHIYNWRRSNLCIYTLSIRNLGEK